MKEETIYTYILIKKSDNSYMGWSRSDTEKPAGTGMQWIEWNKPLPEDINPAQYTQADLEKWYNDNYDENGELVKQ